MAELRTQQEPLQQYLARTCDCHGVIHYPVEPVDCDTSEMTDEQSPPDPDHPPG